MIRVKKAFYDLKEGKYREVGEEFKASKERFLELEALLPDYVEEVKKQPSKKGVKADG